ncbi:MAG: SPOR domain-containing protein [Bordetella sp.]|nr:SPOR domain-containing protein [Bordetella sp.]
MTAFVLLRALPICVLAGLLAGCGGAESGPRRFESAAERIAAIPLSDRDGPAAPLKVELMTPHELWDAREGLAAKVRRASVSAPSAYVDPEAATPQRAAAAARQVQLGAFSSEDGAREAWARLERGPGGTALSGLQPAYEAVEVGGRRLVRLKVAASAERALVLCRALAASDPWCVRSGGAPA